MTDAFPPNPPWRSGKSAGKAAHRGEHILAQHIEQRERLDAHLLGGNKFEFRMVGSDMSIACPNIIINTIVADALEEFADELEKSGALNPNVRKINVNTLKYQVPGGMLSNLMKQLKEAGKLDKLDEVLAEVPNVRKDCGYPPLVTFLASLYLKKFTATSLKSA